MENHCIYQWNRKFSTFNKLTLNVNDDTISQFVEVLASCSICTGNRDFVDVLNKRVDFWEPFLEADQQRSAYVESVKGGSDLVKEDFTTIRSVN